MPFSPGTPHSEASLMAVFAWLNLFPEMGDIC